MQGNGAARSSLMGQSIEVTGFNGWSMALTGCKEDQLTGSRKRLIVSLSDKWHSDLVISF